MKVLIACETSGLVRDAFIDRGHDAVSCDILPTDRPGPHLQCPVEDILDDGWDMLIGFPPCTDLCVSGARWFPAKRADGRQQRSIEFFMRLATADIPRIAIENPVGIMSTQYRRPTQVIQPWMFGEDAAKATCLWLTNLPALRPTDILPCPTSGRWGNQTPSGQNKLGPSKDRWKLRSATYPGIAIAMADQWG